VTGVDWSALWWFVPVALLIPAFVKDHRAFCKGSKHLHN
jgi:hypothetical protein